MRTHKISLTILLAFLFAGISASGQSHWKPLQQTAEGFIYQKIVELPEQSQSQLYAQAKGWFNPANACHLLMHSESTGTLTGSGSFNFSYRKGIYEEKKTLYYTLKIESKEGKLRYTYYNMVLRSYGEANREPLETYAEDCKKDGRLRKEAATIKEQVIEKILTSAESLEKQVQQQAVADNW